jgi:histone acetyltransferase (RNA polymerase elongator complex component)
MSTNTPEPYKGFEQGPIRPPSEAASLLLRVMRNCPWNRCSFCPLYKKNRFSRRPVDHVKRDIDAVSKSIQAIQQHSGSGGTLAALDFQKLQHSYQLDPGALQAAWNWRKHGQRQVFLQDADALALKPEDLLEMLRHLRQAFPDIQRVTCYSRSSTAARLSEEALAALKEAGLNRIHIGMESGADEVLRMVRKGATQALHIKAGQKLKSAGLELSEYYMPGLGGHGLWEKNARETAAAINQINPDFIRIRTLVLPPDAPLSVETEAGRFSPAPDDVMVQELLLFVELLQGISSTVLSDHIVNLLPEMEGVMPHDQERMLEVMRGYLELDPERRTLYKVGRRLGFLSRPSDLDRPQAAAEVADFCSHHGITPDNVDAFTAELARRYI